MIVLDTNVVAELMRREPQHNVVEWIDARMTEDLFLTATTASELLFGVARLPDGKRKVDFAHQLNELFSTDFANRILAFDAIAAGHYEDIAASRERLGRPIGMADAQIASVCRSFGAILATRNTADFEETGIDLVNPWEVS
jgi:toxin FitB